MITKNKHVYTDEVIHALLVNTDEQMMLIPMKLYYQPYPYRESEYPLPTKIAIEQAGKFLQIAYSSSLSDKLPSVLITPNVGGLDLSWRDDRYIKKQGHYDRRYLKIYCPPNRRSEPLHLFYDERIIYKHHYGVENILNDSIFIRWLRWLVCES